MTLPTRRPFSNCGRHVLDHRSWSPDLDDFRHNLRHYIDYLVADLLDDEFLCTLLEALFQILRYWHVDALVADSLGDAFL